LNGSLTLTASINNILLVWKERKDPRLDEVTALEREKAISPKKTVDKCFEIKNAGILIVS
jgi:hypothetical protein